DDDQEFDKRKPRVSRSADADGDLFFLRRVGQPGFSCVRAHSGRGWMDGSAGNHFFSENFQLPRPRAASATLAWHGAEHSIFLEARRNFLVFWCNFFVVIVGESRMTHQSSGDQSRRLARAFWALAR